MSTQHECEVREQEVLAGMLAYGADVCAEVAELLRPEHFTSQTYASIYEFMLADKANRDPSVLAVRFKDSVLDPEMFFADLKRVCTAKDYVVPTAALMVEEWKNGKISEALMSVLNPQLGKTADEKIDSILSDLRDISQSTSKATAKPWAVLVGELKDALGKPPPKNRLHLGFGRTDKVLGGIDPSDFVVVAARPSVGKSAFAIQVASNISRQGKKILLISLEMPDIQIAERLAAKESAVELSAIRGRELAGAAGDVEKDQIGDALDQTMFWNLFVLECGTITPAAVERMVRTESYDVVIIDHLGLMKSGEKTNTREQEVSTISRGLRKVAMDCNIQIIALSQLNRAVESRSNRLVQLSDLRDSGGIEQDATAVIGISISNQDSEQRVVEILKNRNGACGKMMFRFDGAHMKFTELDFDYDEPPPQRWPSM